MLGKKNFSFLEEKIREYESFSFLEHSDDPGLILNPFELEKSDSLETGIKYLREGRYVEAINYFEQQAHLFSSNPYFICSLSDSYYKSGNIEYAIKLLENFTEKNTFDILVFKKLGFLFHKTGNIEKALNVYETILEKIPGDFDTMSRLSSYYVLIRKYDTAIDTLNKLLRFFPVDEKFNMIIGLCYVETKRYYEAIITFEKILYRNPNSDEINASLAGAYFYNSNYEKAIKHFQKAISLNPNKTDYYLNLALCFEKSRRISDSIKILKSVPYNLIDSNIRFLLAKYYIRIGDFQNAIPEIKILKDDSPKLASELFEEIFYDNFKSLPINDSVFQTPHFAKLKGIEIYIHLKNNRNTYHFMNISGGIKGKTAQTQIENESWRDHIYEICKSPVPNSTDWFSINEFIRLIDHKYKSVYDHPENKSVVKNEEYYYHLLEIHPFASQQEIKSAYKRKLKLYHPDKVASLGKELQEVAQEITKNLTEAYEFIRHRRMF